jgi:hypothetical protein
LEFRVINITALWVVTRCSFVNSTSVSNELSAYKFMVQLWRVAGAQGVEEDINTTIGIIPLGEYTMGS